MRHSKISPASWLWAGGAALCVFAARCREIHLYTGDTPYLDQWWVEGKQILLPWLQGTLSWPAFFTPHHEHIPAWSRLFAWLQAAWLGRWDPLLQCTVNAAIFGITVGLWANWFRRTLPLVPALFFTLGAIAFASLPHAWENSTWGFQIHMPLALLFVTWYIHGVFVHATGSAKWWIAQAAGIAAFFTMGTMWVAPAAVALCALWSGKKDRKQLISSVLLAGAGLTLMLVARSVQPHSGAFSLSADSPQQFIAAFFLQLGWPAQWPGVAVVLCAPAFLIALDLRRNSRAEPVDLIILAVILWAVVQAAAFAYGRGSYLGFVSRYGDFLALGVLANGLALWRLLHRHRSWRLPLALLAIGWLGTVAPGLKYVSTRAHTEYFHGHAAIWGELRRDAVRQYLTNRDSGPLSSEAVRNVLFPDPAVVTECLDQPGLAPLLPITLRPDGLAVKGDFYSLAAAQIRNIWPTLGASGAILLLLGCVLTARHPFARSPASPEAIDAPKPLRLVAILCGVTGALVFLWPAPFDFRSEKGWNEMILPDGVIGDLSFKITTPSEYPGDRIIGAASLSPVDFRNTFFGTHVDGPTFTGRAESSPFPITTSWLVIPFAGFPASPANSLLLQIEDAAGKIVAELACPGPNPTNDIGFWGVDVRAYPGQQARLVFIDGRNSDDGWLAASPPQPTQDGKRADQLQRSWKLARTIVGHQSVALLFAGLLLFTLGLLFRQKASRVKTNHRAPESTH